VMLVTVLVVRMTVTAFGGRQDRIAAGAAVIAGAVGGVVGGEQRPSCQR